MILDTLPMNAPIKKDIVWIKKMIDRTTTSLRLDRFSNIVPGMFALVKGFFYKTNRNLFGAKDLAFDGHNDKRWQLPVCFPLYELIWWYKLMCCQHTWGVANTFTYTELIIDKKKKTRQTLTRKDNCRTVRYSMPTVCLRIVAATKTMDRFYTKTCKRMFWATETASFMWQSQNKQTKQGAHEMLSVVPLPRTLHRIMHKTYIGTFGSSSELLGLKLPESVSVAGQWSINPHWF